MTSEIHRLKEMHAQQIAAEEARLVEVERKVR
jgi:hypothetical protein